MKLDEKNQIAINTLIDMLIKRRIIKTKKDFQDAYWEMGIRFFGEQEMNKKESPEEEMTVINRTEFQVPNKVAHRINIVEDVKVSDDDGLDEEEYKQPIKKPIKKKEATMGRTKGAKNKNKKTAPQGQVKQDKVQEKPQKEEKAQEKTQQQPTPHDEDFTADDKSAAESSAESKEEKESESNDDVTFADSEIMPEQEAPIKEKTASKKTYACSECDETFEVPIRLALHKRKMHPKKKTVTEITEE